MYFARFLDFVFIWSLLEGPKNVADHPLSVKLSSAEEGLFLTLGAVRNVIEQTFSHSALMI